MDEKLREKLLAPFPKEVVKNPPKGKFGNYVNHAVYVERLRDCNVRYSWHFEPTIIDGQVIGGIGTIQVEGVGTFQGAGDVEHSALQRATKGECMKLAESDAFKRACMRFGLGVELWSGTDDFFIDTSDVQKAATKKVEEPKQKFLDEDPSDMLNRLREGLAFHESDSNKRKQIKDKAWSDWKKADKKTNVSDWTEDDYNEFMDLFVQYQQDTDVIKDLGEVFDAGVVDKGTKPIMTCPQCDKSDDITDNRQKKAEAPEGSGIKKIPDFTCQQNNKYNPENNGCGWGGYIGSKGDRAVPEAWL
jgi:hypothetical protein